MAPALSGTEGYAEEAEALLVQYEAVPFADVHAPVLHLFPEAPGRVLDVGAGTGRDAAGFAALGHEVVAVEPTEALRLPAMALHASPLIDWLDDGLPELAAVRARREAYDLVMLTAVWMHLDPDQRRSAMPNLASLLADSGALIMMVRHGPVPAGRRMFEIPARETIALADEAGLHCLLHDESESERRRGVHWTRLAFRKR
jgi:SAM-dependent methyltransferase